MKRIFVFILIPLFQLNCHGQSNKMNLSDKIEITCKDLLDLRLQILAEQMTSGSYRILDMGKLGFPVSITINNKNKIEFKIEGITENQFSEEIQKNIMSEGFKFANVAINELIRTNFSNVNFDCSNDIIGYWYYKNDITPCAKWDKNVFELLRH
jgi:hypothetical protein